MRQPEFPAPDAMDANGAADASREVDAALTGAPPLSEQAPQDTSDFQPPQAPQEPAPEFAPPVEERAPVASAATATAGDLADQPTVMTPTPDLSDQPTVMTPTPDLADQLADSAPDAALARDLAGDPAAMTPEAGLADQPTVMTPAALADQETQLLITPDLTDQPTALLAVPLAAAWESADATDGVASPPPAAPPPAVAEPEGEPPAPPAFGALLPMAPGMAMSGAPPFPIPTFPRYGPPSGDLSQPLPAQPPRAARVTAPISPEAAQEFLGPSPVLAPSSSVAPAAPDVRPRAAPKTAPVTPLASTSVSGRLSAALPDAWRRDYRARWGVVGAIALLVAVVVAMLWPVINQQVNRALGVEDLPALTTRLEGDTQTTSLGAASAGFGATTYPTAQPFLAYYAKRQGAATLGSAITPMFTTNLGQTQFFANGALINAGAASPDDVAGVASAGPGDLDPDLARNGVDDQARGVIALPLSQALLELGSEAPLGGAESDATYATLRAAAQPASYLAPPAASYAAQTLRRPGAPVTLVSSEAVFVIEGKRASHNVGHAIPLALWTYLTSPGVAPQGWWVDIGEPLTEAIPITATRDGGRHQMLVQAFTQTVLAVDLDAPDATGAPSVIPQPVGQDYLRTLGGPTAYTANGAQRWLTADGALRPTAGSATVAVGVNTNGAVRLTGESRWVAGALWYGVSWQTPTRTGDAWTLAAALTATRPSGIPTYGFDVLSPSLESYLDARGSLVGVVAYDVTRGAMYSYNAHGEFIMASSAKVPLLISYLENIESQGRGPNDFEVATMTAMIENSDNNAAEVIYDTLGYDAGQDAYMASWGITDYQSNPNGWGWAEWSPSDMAHLLSLLQSGKVLNASDRNLAFYLMSHIEPDQQFGVGDSAPAGAAFWMKNGWVTGPDNTWDVNSSGIVTVGSETYIVTVYSGELDPNTGYTDGVNIVNQVCGSIGQALT